MFLTTKPLRSLIFILSILNLTGNPVDSSLKLTDRRSNRKSDTITTILDQVDNVTMMQRVYINMVHCQDSISNLESATSFSRRS